MMLCPHGSAECCVGKVVAHLYICLKTVASTHMRRKKMQPCQQKRCRPKMYGLILHWKGSFGWGKVLGQCWRGCVDHDRHVTAAVHKQYSRGGGESRRHQNHTPQGVALPVQCVAPCPSRLLPKFFVALSKHCAQNCACNSACWFSILPRSLTSGIIQRPFKKPVRFAALIWLCLMWGGAPGKIRADAHRVSFSSTA